MLSALVSLCSKTGCNLQNGRRPLYLAAYEILVLYYEFVWCFHWFEQERGRLGQINFSIDGLGNKGPAQDQKLEGTDVA